MLEIPSGYVVHVAGTVPDAWMCEHGLYRYGTNDHICTWITLTKESKMGTKKAKTKAENFDGEQGSETEKVRKPRELQPLTIASRAMTAAMREQAAFSIKINKLRADLAEAEAGHKRATAAAHEARQNLNALTAEPAEA